jgi:hypothetical protein
MEGRRTTMPDMIEQHNLDNPDHEAPADHERDTADAKPRHLTEDFRTYYGLQRSTDDVTRNLPLVSSLKRLKQDLTLFQTNPDEHVDAAPSDEDWVSIISSYPTLAQS